MLSILTLLVSLGEAAIVSPVKSGVWSDATLWSGGQVPQAGDEVEIRGGFNVTLDVNTLGLLGVKVLSGTLDVSSFTLNVTAEPSAGILIDGGDLNGSTGTIIDNGDWQLRSGSFTQGTSRVIFRGATPSSVTGSTTFYDVLVEKDALITLFADVTVRHDFVSDLSLHPDGLIAGPGSLYASRDVIYLGSAPTDWTGAIIMSDSIYKSSRLRIAPPNGAAYTQPFIFPRVIIEKPDTTFYVRFGFIDPINDARHGDSLYLTLIGTGADTAISVRSGTLDAGAGIITAINGTRDIARGPFVHIGTNAKFRMAAPPDFDTALVAYFDLDSASVFEYYESIQTDVSLLANNLIRHEYSILQLDGKVIAAFKYNPVNVREALVIHEGSHFSAGIGAGPLSAQTITISGDVINENIGESGSPGAGRTGDGMTPANDTWIFNNEIDTSHWIGPGEMSNIVVRSNTVLSVRYFDRARADSLLVHERITEEGAACGGHVIGKLVAAARRLFEQNPASDFGGIGLTITSGTDPYLGVTSVTRTAGYPPPDESNGAEFGLTINRVYAIYPEAGPQRGATNRIKFCFHCDELNGRSLSKLQPWRTYTGGQSWAPSGTVVEIDSANNCITFDTSAVAYPNGSNSWLWTLSEHYRDYPLPVELAAFSVRRVGAEAFVEWQTTYEQNIDGFEVLRIQDSNRETRVSYRWDARLKSQSSDGALYAVVDPLEPLTAVKYELYSVSIDGTSKLLASRTLSTKPTIGTSIGIYPNPAFDILTVRSDETITRFTIHDASGRVMKDVGIVLSTEQHTIDLSALPAGYYVLTTTLGNLRVRTPFLHYRR